MRTLPKNWLALALAITGPALVTGTARAEISDGVVKIGCHKIRWEEVELLAASAGWDKENDDGEEEQAA